MTAANPGAGADRIEPSRVRRSNARSAHGEIGPGCALGRVVSVDAGIAPSIAIDLTYAVSGRKLRTKSVECLRGEKAASWSPRVAATAV